MRKVQSVNCFQGGRFRVSNFFPPLIISIKVGRQSETRAGTREIRGRERESRERERESRERERDSHFPLIRKRIGRGRATEGKNVKSVSRKQSVIDLNDIIWVNKLIREKGHGDHTRAGKVRSADRRSDVD